MKNEVASSDEKNTDSSFSFKTRKPAYLAAAVILIGLLIIYLLNVYHNKHENNSSLPQAKLRKS